ncbi:hypothetical protein M0802_012846 [Mischocyttarus mexicanus]|nr:hypothetical protein M0802_012847 [Mischocyttarus mexicanus]KAI4485028.1 hypothetical protein M0802_012846 [Mischocyttarus mexicanus]
MPTSMAGMGALAGGMSGVPVTAISGGLQGTTMASIELGKKRMRDSNDDLLMMDMKSVGSFYYENFAFPGMVPYKRPAADKSGMPVYQPTGATTLMQLQQPFVPVSCEYTGTPPLPTQTSNHSVMQPPNVQSNHHHHHHHAVVQSSSSSQGTGGVSVGNCADANNSVLMDPCNNPPPPPPTTGDNNSSASNAANMANLNMLNSLGMSGLPTHLDAAALAKEVAQKNYAKAIKLSQASQSYGISQLTALNYTGVALNKQTLVNPASAAAAAAAAGPGSALQASALSGNTGTPRSVIPGLAGIPGALTSPLSAGILAYSRPQPTATPINPYSLIRQQILPNPYVQASIPGVPGATAAAVQTSPYVQNPYAVLPGMAGVPAGVAAAAGVPTVPQLPQIPNPATIAAQPQVAIPVSSGVIMQPYKKMKTS